MTEHYFSQKPQSKSSPHTWKYKLRNQLFTFTTGAGVFSKHEVDFGTRLLIEQFTPPAIDGALLDMGCGYGPIGIALAASFPGRKIVMADVNERALLLAKQNAAQNGVDNVAFVQSDLFSNLEDAAFAAILTNPPIRAGKKVVHGIFTNGKEALHPGGELWAVIQKKQGAPSAKEKLMELFGEADIVERKKGYYILRAKKQ